MSYEIKSPLSMGAYNAIMENLDVVDDKAMQRIDELAQGSDVSRATVEQVISTRRAELLAEAKQYLASHTQASE